MNMQAIVISTSDLQALLTQDISTYEFSEIIKKGSIRLSEIEDLAYEYGYRRGYEDASNYQKR